MKITAEMIDWDAYRKSVEGTIANENMWALGGSDFADDNIAELKEELEAIDDEDYDFILEKYDYDVMKDYLKSRAYAVDIVWDTDSEDEEDIGLPSRVEIPFFVDDEEIADFLSDEYGYCVFGFNIEQVEETI